VHKKLGGDTARTADPNCPKGYSIPYDIRLSSINLGEEQGMGNVHSDSGCLPKYMLCMMELY